MSRLGRLWWMARIGFSLGVLTHALALVLFTDAPTVLFTAPL